MVLDKLETTKQGRFKKERQNYWEQYVFRIDSSYLRYYGDLKKVLLPHKCTIVFSDIISNFTETSGRD